MLYVITISAVAAYFILIWLKSNAFIEYMTLLRITRFFHIDEYNMLHKDGYGGTYVDFLFEHYNDKFLVRLAACPICLSFWAGFLTFVFLGTLESLTAGPLILFFYLLLHRML